MFVEEKAVGESVPVKVGMLKMSAAMRIGAVMRPQCTGEWFFDGRSCALGAAFEGAGRMNEVLSYKRETEAWPYSQVAEVFGVHYLITDQVYKRNDRGETRESIADWLESQGL